MARDPGEKSYFAQSAAAIADRYAAEREARKREIARWVPILIEAAPELLKKQTKRPPRERRP